MAEDDQLGLEPFEFGEFDFPDFPDSLAALLMPDACGSLDLNDVLKDFVEDAEDESWAASPGEGSSVNNDTMSRADGVDSAGEAPSCDPCCGRSIGPWEAAHPQHAAASSSGSHQENELPGGMPTVRITTGIPGDSGAAPWGGAGSGMVPVAGYQPLETEGHPYPHPFTAPTTRAPPLVPVATKSPTGEAVGRQGKRKKPDVDLSKIEDVEERRRQRRLAKNRNTAAVSRERKKAQLMSLEERVKQLEMDNAGLKYWLAYREQQLQSQNVHLVSLNRDAGETVSEPEAWSEPAELDSHFSIATMLSYLLLLAWPCAKLLVRLMVSLTRQTPGNSPLMSASLEVEWKAEDAVSLADFTAILDWEAFGEMTSGPKWADILDWEAFGKRNSMPKRADKGVGKRRGGWGWYKNRTSLFSW